MAFVVLVFLKRPRLNWTYWPTNRGAVPTERREGDNTDPRLRGGGGRRGESREEREKERGNKGGQERRWGRGGGGRRERR